MHIKRGLLLSLPIFLLGVILVSSFSSAIWPFTSSKSPITGNAISYSDSLPLCIGYELGTGGCTDGSAFYGYIDEVLIYNRALSDSEAIGLAGLNAPSSGQVGYWNFDSSRTPSLQNNANVIIDPSGSALDNILSLNGNNQFAQVSYSSDLNPAEELSFSAWFKSNDYSRSQRIISAVQGGGYGLVLNDPYGVCRSDTLCAIVRSDSSYLVAEVPRSQLPASPYSAFNGWYQAVATYDGTTLKLFVNGKQVAPPLPTNTTVQRGGECDARTGLQHTRVCSSGLTCQDTNGDGLGACRSSVGQSCSNTNDCLSGYGLTCSSGVCATSSSTVTVAMGSECDMREVPRKRICNAGATCQDTNDDGIGACRHAAGMSCYQDSDCLAGVASLKCISSVCTVVTPAANLTIAPSNARINASLGSECDVIPTAAGTQRVCTPGVTCQDTDNNKVGACRNTFGQMCNIDSDCLSGQGLSCVANKCTNARTVTDISARGFTEAGSKTLVLGFQPATNGNVLATIEDGWQSSAKIAASSITTTLSTNAGNLLSDSDPSTNGLRASVEVGEYGLAAVPSSGSGSVVLSTYNTTIPYKQFSARGFVDTNNPLILGFTVKGDRVNLEIHSRPDKLPTEFSPTLPHIGYTVKLYQGSQLLYTSQNTIGPQLTAGMYTVVVEPNGSRSGFMLLEVMDMNYYSQSDETVAQVSNIEVQENATVTPNNIISDVTVPTDLSSAALCADGCLEEDICYPSNHIRSGLYCDGNLGEFMAQKPLDSPCDSNSECESGACFAETNMCADAPGIARSLVRTITCFFQHPVSSEARYECQQEQF